MTPPVDFVDAHRRHWADAELLFDHERLGNADQLYGFSVECGLKAVMRTLGMPVDQSGHPTRSEHRRHVMDLWPVFKSLARTRRAWHRLKDLPPGSPFSDWSHHDRYSTRGYHSADSVGRHREAALTIRRMAQRTEQEGTP